MLTLALRNLLRHPLRTGVTLAAIVFGIASLILGGGFVRDMYVQLGEALIHSQSGHVQLAKEGYFTQGSRYPEKHQLEKIDTLARDIAAVPGVEQVMARSHFSGLLSNGRTDRPIVGEGIEPAREARLGTYLEIVAGRSLGDSDPFGAMIGQGLSQSLGLSPGDQVTLLANTIDGSLNTLELEIVGVFRTFSRDFDARSIRIPLEAAQELTGAPGANVLVMELNATGDTERLATLLRERFTGRSLEVRTWIELSDFYEKTVALYDRQFGVIQLITMILVLLGVANSVNMSVFERIGEFGTMMALGNRSGHVFRLVMTETVILALAGAVLGALLGMGLALAISAVGIPMPPPPNANVGYRALIRLSPALVGGACAIGFLAAILAALLPARRATRVPVVDALRFNI